MNLLKGLTAVMAVGTLAACSGSKMGSGGDSGSDNVAASEVLSAPLIMETSAPVDFSQTNKMSKMDVNKYPITKLVCDPLGGGSPQPQSNAGLQAELYWINPLTQPHYTNVSDYITYGLKSDKTLFFSQLNVPTRMFSLGFPLEAGGSVSDDSNNKLIEYFALRFKTVLKLNPDQPEGLYEFAVLSDDGTIVKMRNENGDYVELVNNDGTHPSRFGCGSQYVDMKRDTEKLLQIDYYQGPKYHISAIMMMRKVQTAANGSIIRDSACGTSGNNLFFDPNNNSAPQAAYNALLSRGWTPLNAKNYSLPVQALFNPCMAGIAPVITNFHIVERSDTSVWLEWNTDIPATSQVLYRIANSNNLQLTNSDNVLKTTKHTVVIDGLTAGALYEMQAVSISESYGKTISNPIDVDLAF